MISSKFLTPRPLGKNGPLVPALGFGLMMMTAPSYGALPADDERFALLDRAVEIGAMFWDTSDLYGDNEELLAKWFKKTGKRDQIFLASNFGYVRGSTTLEIDSSPQYCKKACDVTLKVLGIDYIDLYYAHNVDTVTPIEETMRALLELQAEGKIKHIGLSMVSSKALRRAAKIGTVAAYQPAYSLFDRKIEGSEGTNAFATCRELGIAIVAATPLGRGLLTSRFSSGGSVGDDTDVRGRAMPRFLEGQREQNAHVAAQIKVVADRKGCSLPQLALAWLLRQGDDVFPIPGGKIRAIVDKAPVAGGAVPAQFTELLFRDTKEE
ncbi:hypothetical protein UA08_03876 [Talaromyces atroroseus]|uniref:NADP-dependent oxidoreductase domain-containing protein n=1 Tax=Talaromyces atroroseus TaxID=1441469 RepID=A0A225AN53_TALAT|nr:hypothetical protein UA08_03876 [Talaromyces atroroseus]OKL60883.1 hypothetical protein UA08_03876 [Talaromyces atroroseus]